ncbi:hypothetical protein FJT64_023551 [Amphibalanus amphitrite]|nr:hypothetical protein FJT64_023551 [Amphibalanus amphitrite]
MADAAGPSSAPEGPPFPLLWNQEPLYWYDLPDADNGTLNMDAKGVYLPGGWDEPLRTSQRLDLPFPLRSAVGGELYRPHSHDAERDGVEGAALPLLAGDLGKGQSQGSGAALPLLAGELGKGLDHDPVEEKVDKYWYLKSHVEKYALIPDGATRSQMHGSSGVTREQARGVLDQIKQGATVLPKLSLPLRNVLSLAQFLTKNPVFTGWDANDNWLYGGGTMSLMKYSRKLLHTSGENVAVADLVAPGDWEDSSHRTGEDSSSYSRLWAEDEVLLTWPEDETVLQIDAADLPPDEGGLEAAVVRSLSSVRFYLKPARRLMLLDEFTPSHPPAAVALHRSAKRRWAAVDTSGDCTVRDGISGRKICSALLPKVERKIGWFGLHGLTHTDCYQVASWERVYHLDCRGGRSSVLFQMSDNGHLFRSGERLHAIRRSTVRDNLTLLTTNRHLVVLDERRPDVPWLWSRLTLPPAGVYLSSCPAACRGPGGADTELITVACQTDSHVQALVYDWAAGAELAASRPLGCARPPVEAAGPPAAETHRRLEQLALTGVVADRPARGHNCVYTTNSCGDVFVHPLVPLDGCGDGGGHRRTGEEAPAEELDDWNKPPELQPKKFRRYNGTMWAGTKPPRRAPPPREVKPLRVTEQQCRRLVDDWRRTVERQRWHKARVTPLHCDSVVHWSGPTHPPDLLKPPPEAEGESDELPRWSAEKTATLPRRTPERTPQRVNRWLSRLSGGAQGAAGGGPADPVTPGVAGPAGDAADDPVEPSTPWDQTTDGSSTDVSTPPRSEVDEMLSMWETDADLSDEPLSVAEELAANALSIAGSVRRKRVPRYQMRLRRVSGSSAASSRVSSSRLSSSRPGSSVSGRAASAGQSAASGGASTSGSGSAPASSLVTPARPLPAVSHGAAFQQFSMDLFDD